MQSTAAEQPAAGGALAAAERARFNPGWALVILGGLLGVVGAFLTWGRVDYVVKVRVEKGVSAGRDGKFTLVLSVLVLAICAAALLGQFRSWIRRALAILGLVIAFVALADAVNESSVGSQERARLHTSVPITSSNGVGVWLTMLAGVLIVVGVALVARYSRSAPSSEVAAPVGAELASVGEPGEVSSVPAQPDGEPSSTAEVATPRDGDAG